MRAAHNRDALSESGRKGGGCNRDVDVECPICGAFVYSLPDHIADEHSIDDVLGDATHQPDSAQQRAEYAGVRNWELREQIAIAVGNDPGSFYAERPNGAIRYDDAEAVAKQIGAIDPNTPQRPTLPVLRDAIRAHFDLSDKENRGQRFERKHLKVLYERLVEGRNFNTDGRLYGRQ